MGMGFDFHGLRALGRAVVGVLDEVFQVAQEFHDVISTAEQLQQTLGTLRAALAAATRKCAEVEAAVTVEKQRVDAVLDQSARLLQRLARGMIARRRVSAFVRE